MMVLSKAARFGECVGDVLKHVLHRFQLLLAFPEHDRDLFDVLVAQTAGSWLKSGLSEMSASLKLGGFGSGKVGESALVPLRRDIWFVRVLGRYHHEEGLPFARLLNRHDREAADHVIAVVLGRIAELRHLPIDAQTIAEVLGMAPVCNPAIQPAGMLCL